MKKDQHDAREEGIMHDHYLWDGSGTPDAETQRLESLLYRFRHSGQPLALPASLPMAPRKLRGSLLQMPWLPRLAAAVVVFFPLAAGVFLTVRPSRSPGASTGWDVAMLEGAPQIGSQILSDNHVASKLQVGQTLVTNSDSRASISDKDLGEIKVDPNSRVRLLESGERRKRIQLEVGTIHAAIWAPAGQFVVDTPSAVAIDLGCAYTLQVTPDGSGTIRTTLGWVGFRLNERDSFIPAGAMCSTRPAPDRAFRISRMPRPRFARRSHDSTLRQRIRRTATVRLRKFFCRPARAMRSRSGTYFPGRKVQRARMCTITLPR